MPRQRQQLRWRWTMLAADGKELFNVVDQRLMAVPVVANTSFDSGAATILFDRKPARIIDYDVAADGPSFLINSEVSGSETQPLNLVVNWMAALKKSPCRLGNAPERRGLALTPA